MNREAQFLRIGSCHGIEQHPSGSFRWSEERASFILPAGWIHYQTVLLIPFYQVLVRAETNPGSISRPALLLYGLAWLLLCFGDTTFG